MTRFDLTRHAPCGVNLQWEKNTFLTCAALAAAATLPFLSRLSTARQELFYRTGESGRALIPGAVMPDFITLLENAFWGFGVMMLLSLSLVIYHYAYHYQGAKSIYLMRRLPDPRELHRRCWTLPLLFVAALALLAAALFLLYFAIYHLATPAPCLAPGQWQKIWSVIL